MSKTIEKVKTTLLYRDGPFYAPIRLIEVSLTGAEPNACFHYQGLLGEALCTEVSLGDVPKFLAFLGRPERRKLILG